MTNLTRNHGIPESCSTHGSVTVPSPSRPRNASRARALLFCSDCCGRVRFPADSIPSQQSPEAKEQALLHELALLRARVAELEAKLSSLVGLQEAFTLAVNFNDADEDSLENVLSEALQKVNEENKKEKKKEEEKKKKKENEEEKEKESRWRFSSCNDSSCPHFISALPNCTHMLFP